MFIIALAGLFPFAAGLSPHTLLITHISGQQNSALLISACSDNPVAWEDLYALGSRGIRAG
jgi:hypothetical protein